MLGYILKNGKLITIAIIYVGAITTLSLAINNIPWIWLTYFFKMIRTTAQMFDFMIDLPTLYSTITIALGVQIAYWTFKVTLLVVEWIKD